MHHQFTVLAERVNVVITGLQRQSETDRRRVTQLERKLEARLEDRAHQGDGREKWAEIQGSVTGLIEETQALTRRVEGLDERLWARTSGSELAKQRNRELEQQVQSLEQQARLSQSTLEETHKRQAAKLRRAEHSLEEAQRRLAKLEEEVRVKQQNSHPRDGYLEARVGALEHQQERLDNDVRTMQMHIDDGLQGAANMVPQDDGVMDEAGTTGLEDAIQATERGLGALEKKVSSQVEDLAASLASMRVKVDGQLQRVGTLAERIESAHEPALDSMRAELAQARQQDRREVDHELASLRNRFQEATEGTDESMVEVREALRQNAAQIAALSLRPEESPVLHGLDERIAVQEQEIGDIRARLDSMAGMDDEALEAMGGKMPEAHDDDLEDLRRRLEWLEEQGAAGAATDRADQRQAQDTICDLVQGVSRLRQQASSGESAQAALSQQVQQLQGLIERRWSEEATKSRTSPEVEAKVTEMWEKVAELHARLLEVEGGLDFARANDTGTFGEVSIISKDGGRVIPPLPGGEVDPERSGQGAGTNGALARDRNSVEVKEKLEAVAEHLEVVDDLADRVAELERRAFSLEPGPMLSSPAKTSEVSFGGDAPIKDAAKDKAAGSTELHARVLASEQELKALRESISKQESTGQRLEASTKELSRRIVTLTEDSGKEKAKQDDTRLSEEIQSRLANSEKELQTLREGVSKQESAGRRLEELEAGARSHSEAQGQLSRRIEELGGQLREAAETTAAALRKELQQLQDKSVVDRGSGLDEVRREVGKLSVELSEAKDAVACLRQSAPTQEASLKDLRQELGDLRARNDRAGSGGDIAEQLASRLRTLEERMGDSASPAVVSRAVDEQVRLMVQKQVEELTTKVEGELANLLDHQKELADAKSSLKELAAQAPAGEAASNLKDGGSPELGERLRLVEERLNDVAGGSAAPPSEDMLLRADVGEQVEALREKISRELSSLAHLQDGLGGARASIQALEERGSSLAQAERSQASAMDSLKSQVKAACQRAQAAEDATSTVKRELEQLQGPRKVGISLGGDPGSPLSVVRKRLDVLSEQVADLQQTRGRAAHVSATGSRSPPRSSRSPDPSRDASLNFSLTEQTEKPAGEGSLNFSLTQSKTDLSFSEPIVGVSGKRGPDSASTGLGITGSSTAATASSDSKASSASSQSSGDGKKTLGSRLGELPELKGSGGRRGSGSNDALDSLIGGKLGGRGGGTDSLGGARGSGGDVLDSLVGGGSSSSTSSTTLGGRPRPSPLRLMEEERGPLATVAEESSDVGETSFESHRSQGGRQRNRTPVSGKSPPGVVPSESPSNSVGSLENSRSNLEVSVSCQEVSIGHDYSVEDSQELDKCDFVEVVKPKISPGRPEASGSSVGASSIGVGKATASSGKAVDALDALVSKPKVGTASSSVVSSAPAAKAASPEPAPKAAKAKEEEDDKEYDESFEDNGSVSESIQESVSGSGASDAWGDGEDL